METLFIKCKEDKQISPDEFELFQKLLKDFENHKNLKTAIKMKDIKKVRKQAKKEIREQQMNMLLKNTSKNSSKFILLSCYISIKS